MEAKTNVPMPSGPGGCLNVTWWPTVRLVPYAHNARVCPSSAIDKVAASIAEFGWKVPLVVDAKGEVVAGHTRLLAAKQLGLDRVPVIVADDLSAAQIKAFRIADNRSAQETSWDLDLLAGELGDLAGLDYELDLTGFEPDELAEILARPDVGCCDPDELPPEVPEPLTKPGDLWLCGEHRLLCGDATDPAAVARLMDGRRAVLMATDPPYLVNYDGGNHPHTWANGGKRGADPDRHWDSYIDHEHSLAFYAAFLRAALDEALTGRVAIYQFFAALRSEFVWQAWREVGLHPHQVVIWRKSRAVLTHSWYMWDFEPILVGYRREQPPKHKPPAEAHAVWEVASGIEDRPGHIHPTIKPVELIRRPICYHTKRQELIYEPFCGSGTALIAAEMTGRACYALEISPAFCDAAVARWSHFTGREAVRHG